MAIGLGKMMGLHFLENFNHPYIASSIGDFWRRWLISLSTWFRDYVFFPLERRRIPVLGQPLNIIIVFLLTGLWHGVTSTLIAWGLLHGLFIAMEGLFLNCLLQKPGPVVRHVYVLSVLLLSWLVCCAPSLVLYYYSFFFRVNLLLGEHFHSGILVQNFVAGGFWTLDWVEEEKPDVVIIEFSERYLGKLLKLIERE
jgi:D-alanyl-lipoteichoic acid acyltransferase DltB (MBOAT superfamily)